MQRREAKGIFRLRGNKRLREERVNRVTGLYRKERGCSNQRFNEAAGEVRTGGVPHGQC